MHEVSAAQFIMSPPCSAGRGRSRGAQRFVVGGWFNGNRAGHGAIQPLSTHSRPRKSLVLRSQQKPASSAKLIFKVDGSRRNLRKPSSDIASFRQGVRPRFAPRNAMGWLTVGSFGMPEGSGQVSSLPSTSRISCFYCKARQRPRVRVSAPTFSENFSSGPPSRRRGPPGAP